MTFVFSDSTVSPNDVRAALLDELANALQVIVVVATVVRPTLEHAGLAERARHLESAAKRGMVALARLRELTQVVARADAPRA